MLITLGYVALAVSCAVACGAMLRLAGRVESAAELGAAVTLDVCFFAAGVFFIGKAMGL